MVSSAVLCTVWAERGAHLEGSPGVWPCAVWLDSLFPEIGSSSFQTWMGSRAGTPQSCGLGTLVIPFSRGQLWAAFMFCLGQVTLSRVQGLPALVPWLPVSSACVFVILWLLAGSLGPQLLVRQEASLSGFQQTSVVARLPLSTWVTALLLFPLGVLGACPPWGGMQWSHPQSVSFAQGLRDAPHAWAGSVLRAPQS